MDQNSIMHLVDDKIPGKRKKYIIINLDNDVGQPTESEPIPGTDMVTQRCV